MGSLFVKIPGNTAVISNSKVLKSERMVTATYIRVNAKQKKCITKHRQELDEKL